MITYQENNNRKRGEEGREGDGGTKGRFYSTFVGDYITMMEGGGWRILTALKVYISVCLVVIIKSLSFLLAVMFPLCCGGTFQMNSIYDLPHRNSAQTSFPLHQPIAQFVFQDSANVSAILGKTAHLNCRVRGVGNRTVRFRQLLVQTDHPIIRCPGYDIRIPTC